MNLTNADGEVIKSYTYDAFGVEKNIDENDTNAFRYCGEYFDAETDTVYLRARYYNPTTGRFISRDSYAGRRSDPLSLNLYTYCANNPLRFVDPSGHSYATLPDGSTMTINSAWDAEKFEEKKASMKKGAPGCKYGECSVSVSLEYQSTDLTDDMKKANAQVIKNYFSDKGWSLEATCAVLGNIEHESRLNPNAWQDEYFDDRENGNCGYGLCQFTSAKDFLPKIGYDIDTIDNYAIKNPGKLMIMQLDYIIESPQPGNGIFYPDYGSYGSNYNMTFDEFTHSTLNVRELALVFHGHYERSGDEDSGYKNRQDCAEFWYNHFTNQ